MTDNLIICPHCGSNACYHVLDTEELQPVNMYNCFGCGFHTNDALFNKTQTTFIEALEKTMPELYKAIKFEDINGNFWYPQTVHNITKGMVFAYGTSKDDWRWSAIIAKPIDKKDKNKHKPSTTHTMDMSTKKEFERGDYMEALDYIGFFQKQ